MKNNLTPDQLFNLMINFLWKQTKWVSQQKVEKYSMWGTWEMGRENSIHAEERRVAVSHWI